MQKIELGQTITILANVGVIVGIVFLSIEINQSNRIATYEARSALTANSREIARTAWENSEVAEFMLKLTTPGQELTELDQHRADNLARTVISNAVEVVIATDSGFVPNDILPRYVDNQTVFLNRYPGLATYIRGAIEQNPGLQFATGPTGPLIMRSLGEQIDRIEQVQTRPNR